MAVTVKLEMGRLTALQSDVPNDADRIVEEVARELEGAAKVNAVVDTGAMRASITVQNIGKAMRRIGPTVRYAIFVELGTRFRHARPFLKPAFDSEAPKLAERLKSIFS